jgi:translation initiation factor 1
MKPRERPSGRTDARLVFSTERKPVCTQCGWPTDRCACSQAEPARGDGIVRVGRETKGRAGKGVTVITGVPVTEGELTTLAAELKRRCGSGGTVKNATIEIQGDHRDAIVDVLIARGFKVKRTGG